MPVHYVFFAIAVVIHLVAGIAKADPPRRIEVVVPQELLAESPHIVVRLTPAGEAELQGESSASSTSAVVALSGGALLPILGTEPVPFGRINLGLRFEYVEVLTWVWVVPDIHPYLGVRVDQKQPMYGGGVHFSLRLNGNEHVHPYIGVGPQAQLLLVPALTDPIAVGISAIGGIDLSYPLGDNSSVLVGIGVNVLHCLYRDEEFPTPLETLVNMFAQISFRL
tara:strand:+ start:2347 stop:3015 length:669 start_codon:yes stop_codon:yes gene_type:complete